MHRVRKNNRKCLSAQDDVNVTDLLHEIVKYGVYREDYEQITRQLLFRPISYEQAIQGVEKLIEEQVFS